jgi:hypothetical protein
VTSPSLCEGRAKRGEGWSAGPKGSKQNVPLSFVAPAVEQLGHDKDVERRDGKTAPLTSAVEVVKLPVHRDLKQDPLRWLPGAAMPLKPRRPAISTFLSGLLELRCHNTFIPATYSPVGCAPTGCGGAVWQLGCRKKTRTVGWAIGIARLTAE